jgi:N12 class adenine-specific DNA methylase
VTPIIENAADALALTLHEAGYVDLSRIAELIGRSRDEAIAELGDHVFLDPQFTIENIESWQTADAYLSGPVRTKLAAAVAAAALDPRYHRNVEALRQVQPEDLKPSDISARLGAPWIPAEDAALFSNDIGIKTFIHHTPEIAAWTIDVKAFAGQAAATSEWGTERRHAGQLLSDALNSAIPQICDIFIEDGQEKRILNAAETEAAKEKLQKIKTAFERWVWTDPERADRLSRLYNDQFNNLVPRHFDGSHLRLPGASSVIKFYAHQKRVIWRIISTGQTYVAHAVGAGKTFSIAAAIMEQRRSPHHWRDRRRSDYRRRNPGISQAFLPDQYDQPQRRRSGRLATRLGSLRQIPLHGGKEPWTRSDPRLGDPDHQHPRRNVHPPAVHADGGSRGARHSRIRRLGRDLRRNQDRTRTATLRTLQTRHAPNSSMSPTS